MSSASLIKREPANRLDDTWHLHAAHVCALEHRCIERGIVIQSDVVPGEPVGGRVEQLLAGARPVDLGRAAGLGANCGYRVCGLVDRFCRVM